MGLVGKVKNICEGFAVDLAENRYYKAGFNFAKVLDTSALLGNNSEFESRFLEWEEAEQEYAKYNYSLISFDAFYSAFMGDADVSKLIRIPYEDFFDPILHSDVFRKCFLDDSGLIDITKIGDFVHDDYQVPSTEKAIQKYGFDYFLGK